MGNAQTTKGEAHGCIVCGRLFQLLVVYDTTGRFIDSKVMTPGARTIGHPSRPLVACERHSHAEVEAAVERAYGSGQEDQE